MCGIAGIFEGRIAEDSYPDVLKKMADAIIHRGPDDEGYLALPQLSTGLASRRLSIVDLPGGHQPIANEDETIHVVFNGEIYNHVELRRDLESRGHRFRTNCDTEVIVHAYEEWDVEGLGRLNGMFALAVLDTARRRLLLARDGPGMKHLYWAQTPRGLVFGSEVKALLASGLIEPEVDPEAIRLYLTAGFIPAPFTGFLGIKKLPPGGFVVAESGNVREGRFWIPRYVADEREKSETEYAEELEYLLRQAVARHLAADVPVGAFLSGGWDSSLITTFAAQQSSRRLKTFSIVFPDHPDTDESRYSRLMAQTLGTDHEETEFRTSETEQMVSDVVRHLEEPNVRAPILLVYQLCRLGGSRLNSVLAGEGSDELFGGYSWFQRPDARAGYALRPFTPSGIVGMLSPRLVPPPMRLLLALLAAPDLDAADAAWLSGLSPDVDSSLISSRFRSSKTDLEALLPDPATMASAQGFLHRVLSLEQHGRMADAILLESDKMSMAFSLELRMPFLDRTIVDFALRLPARYKLRGRQEKYILKALTRHLPPEIAQRKKCGLHYPSSFLNSIGGDYARALLLDGATPDGLLNRVQVEQLLSRKESAHRGSIIGALIMLQTWWNEFFLR
ncbi:MAG: asparagine synthase (glutamine-hydrolyzing) [Acidobacteria bacterium]|nr:asparagine synthase (glutamine-hydrolyzing) [Acidobacteriota bacterium]